MTYLMFWLFLCSLGCCHLAHSMFLEQPCGKALVPKILGSNASPLYAQYIAGIFNTTYFLCGGTIIHKDFVLTAAHCNNAQTLFVRLGAYNIQRPTDEIRVIETIPHPEYTNSTYVNDIALLKLERSAIFNINIQPICIYLDATLGKQIRYYNAFGWGKTKNAAQSDILQSVFLNRTNPMICQNHLGLIPDAKQICATSEEGDTCAGDSGGPLIAKINYQSKIFDTQFGIISYGSNECDGLGLYIDVLQYSGWIANTVRGNRDRDVVSRRENGRLLYADCTGDSMGSILMATIFGLQSYAKGVLITDRHVLTAAHCIYKKNKEDIFVRLGEYNTHMLNETRARDFRIANMVLHIDYNPQNYDNDIALVRIDRATIFNTYIWPVCMPPVNEDWSDRNAIVTGWGTQKFGGPHSNILMEVNLPVWKQSDCRSSFVQHVPDTAMCAGFPEGGQDSCQGDSGGPLLVQLPNQRWVTIGIVSWGVGCGQRGRPGIYTRVDRYLDWILANADV